MYIILPTSANPFHIGHQQMIEYAEKNYSVKSRPIVSISCINADKGSISQDEFLRRAKTVPDVYDVIPNYQPLLMDLDLTFSNLAGFEKIVLLGIDTATRMCDNRYYENYEMFLNKVEHLISDGWRFLVFPRNGDSFSRYYWPNPTNVLFSSAVDFVNCDISSTELRRLKESCNDRKTTNEIRY